ncbi:chitinase [Actinoplanes lobatus]|uniref:chitinase n=1 Tax=Actinoplanes lobatus TaxID=113568 RepID=A0A7W7MFG6_9ACTN|nr:glycoside hydrolase family 18 protein [Actinoplanes lobatus]MBB4748322.1 chitinase [Actinoplanes lobatus]GGN70768.1 chitinase [Actinoplanes lobatus]GIE40172.1 chitinase [Actinoplanes lobatus]
MRFRSAFLILILLLAGCGEPPAPVPQPQPLVVAGYLTEWSVYGHDFRVKDLAAERLTHLTYAFGRVTGGRCAMGDAWAAHRRMVSAADSVDGVGDTAADPLRGTFGQLRKLKKQHPGIRLLWSFGGWTGSAGFTEAAKDPAGFAASCRQLLADPRWAGLFDGIDVDWEYPNACGTTCDGSGPAALAGMLSALRAELGPGALISAAAPGDLGRLRATDYAAAARHVDWLGAMTYDYFGAAGSGPGTAAPHSPLEPYPGIPRETATTSATVDELLRAGVPAGKLLIGVGFYGRGWTGTARGLEDYRVLVGRCPPTGTLGGTAYADCGDQWWSYDTPETVGVKVAYARKRELGGLFAWELSGDTHDGALLRALSG